MPGPMPPESAPKQAPPAAPPGGAPAGGPPAQGAPEGGAGGVQTLITGINTDLLKLKEILSNAGLPPEAVAPLDGVIEGYKSFIISLSQGAQGGPPSPQGSQGGNPAQPAKMPLKKPPVPATSGPNGVPAL